jgi:riboflavin transporter FmnP|tara:strand:+ start:6102 stop:6758 length:657 start_codon:yes stop_codon:yes gene_type:complete
LPEIWTQSGNKQSTLKYTLNRSKSITSIAIFAAIAIVLHISPLKIPAPYAPFLIYEFWEIPIIAAFYLYGTNISLAVAIINFLSLLVIFPGTLQAGPIYNLLAIIAMIMGLLIVYQITEKSSRFQSGARLFWLTIIIGPSVRVLVMTGVNALLLPMPPPLGFNAPIGDLEQVLGLPPGTMLLFIAFFNFSVALYSILIARMVIRAVSNAIRIPVKYGV